MRVAALRLEASARNVATVRTASAQPPAGVAGRQLYLLVPVSQTAVAAPASTPTVSSVRNLAPTWMAASSIDIENEMIEQESAKQSFVANAKTLAVAQDRVKALFELTD